MIELRSDTFTLPTAEMRAAMAEAPVGNDVYREDPTVRRLEDLAAGLTGKEAGLLLPSGTMANLVAVLSRVPRGGKLLVGDESDLYLHEAGGAAVCGGAVYGPVPTGPDGRLDLNDLRRGFPDDPDDPEFAPVALICLENSHNRRGGRVLGEAYLRAVHALAREQGVPVHLDGARVFNAAAALDVPVADLARHADTVQFCLSKGLSAPIGSMLVGDTDTVERARRLRKMLGGGMRQAGIIAAAGIVALERMVGRLAEDHRRARTLAEGLAGVPGLRVDVAAVQTNIVVFTLADPAVAVGGFLQAVRHQGVAVAELGVGRIRAVTHAGVGDRDIAEAVATIARVTRRMTAPRIAVRVGAA